MGEPLYLPPAPCDSCILARPFTRNKPLDRYLTNVEIATRKASEDARRPDRRETYVRCAQPLPREGGTNPPSGGGDRVVEVGHTQCDDQDELVALDSFDRVIEVCKDLGTRLHDETHALLDELTRAWLAWL